ncbi:MAG: GAF domain-containing protein [Amnibacterium sp.]
MLTTLLRPVARALLSRVQAELDTVPHPTDAPQYHAPGPAPDRVLIFGNGPAIGFGVRTQELALPGQVGRRLAASTGRGADIDLVARRGTTVEMAAPLIARLRPARYDGIVIVIGATDAAALLPLRRWREAMSALLTEVTKHAAPTSPIVVLGIHELRRSALTSGLLGDIIDCHAQQLNAVTRELCASDPRVQYVARDEARSARVRYQSAQAFGTLAEMIVPALVPGLNASALDRTPAAARCQRSVPAAEVSRQAALHAIGVLDTAPEERFDRIVRSARTTFGTTAAALSFIDGPRQWYKAVAGPSELETRERSMPREVGMCHRTIRHDQALVVPDLATARHVHPDFLAAGYRFYAGYPVESPDGYRVGALCVLDTAPRPDIDVALLREYALRVQRELWVRPDGTVLTDPIR